MVEREKFKAFAREILTFCVSSPGCTAATVTNLSVDLLLFSIFADLVITVQNLLIFFAPCTTGFQTLQYFDLLLELAKASPLSQEPVLIGFQCCHNN